MAAKGGADRVERERAKAYRARREFHDAQIRRRRRDNLIAGIGGGALILAIVGGQVLYYTIGLGTPTPAPSVSTPAPTTTTG